MVSTGATNSLVHAASIVSWLSNVTGAAFGTYGGNSHVDVSAEAVDGRREVVARKKSSWLGSCDSISRIWRKGPASG